MLRCCRGALGAAASRQTDTEIGGVHVEVWGRNATRKDERRMWNTIPERGSPYVLIWFLYYCASLDGKKRAICHWYNEWLTDGGSLWKEQEDEFQLERFFIMNDWISKLFHREKKLSEGLSGEESRRLIPGQNAVRPIGCIFFTHIYRPVALAQLLS